MESIIITPETRKQADRIKKIVQEMGLHFGILDEEVKEDIALLRAMIEGEKDVGEVDVETFLKNLNN